MRTRIARNNQCVLVQPLPSRFTVGANIALQARDAMGHATDAGVYGIRTRITFIDRAIIRSYFQDYCRPSTTRALEMRMPDQHGRTPRALDARLASESPAISLPDALEHKLSALPAGYQRVLVNDDVVLINRETRAIVDVMRHASTRGMPAQRAAPRKHNHAPRYMHQPGDTREDGAARWRLYDRVALL